MRAPSAPTKADDRVVVRLQPCPGCGRCIRLDDVGAEVDGRPVVDYARVALAARVHELTCAG